MRPIAQPQPGCDAGSSHRRQSAETTESVWMLPQLLVSYLFMYWLGR